MCSGLQLSLVNYLFELRIFFLIAKFGVERVFSIWCSWHKGVCFTGTDTDAVSLNALRLFLNKWLFVCLSSFILS